MGETTLLLTTSLGIRKIAEEEEERGDILLSFLMSFTAIRLTSRKGGKGRGGGGKNRKNNINIALLRRFKAGAVLCILNTHVEKMF